MKCSDISLVNYDVQRTTNFWASDLIAVPRRFSDSELNAAHSAIAAARPISVATI